MKVKKVWFQAARVCVGVGGYLFSLLLLLLLVEVIPVHLLS